MLLNPLLGHAQFEGEPVARALWIGPAIGGDWDDPANWSVVQDGAVLPGAVPDVFQLQARVDAYLYETEAGTSTGFYTVNQLLGHNAKLNLGNDFTVLDRTEDTSFNLRQGYDLSVGPAFTGADLTIDVTDGRPDWTSRLKLRSDGATPGTATAAGLSFTNLTERTAHIEANGAGGATLSLTGDSQFVGGVRIEVPVVIAAGKTDFGTEPDPYHNHNDPPPPPSGVIDRLVTIDNSASATLYEGWTLGTSGVIHVETGRLTIRPDHATLSQAHTDSPTLA